MDRAYLEYVRSGNRTVQVQGSIDTLSQHGATASNFAGTGPFSFTVYGGNLGGIIYTVKTRAVPTGCESTEWKSETAVRCHVGHGVRGTRRVMMTLGQFTGSLSQAWSADAGTSRKFLNLSLEANQPGTGSMSLTVHGTGFGFMMYTSQYRIGSTGCEATNWRSQTSVQCLVGQGISGTKHVAITMGERGGSRSQGWSVDLPGLSVMRRSNRPPIPLGLGMGRQGARRRDGHPERRCDVARATAARELGGWQ